MNCYRSNCKEECNDIKKMYCLYRTNKQQQKVIARIRKNYCKECGGTTIKSKYNGKIAKLCTSCGTITRGTKVVRYCLVNSRRAG